MSQVVEQGVRSYFQDHHHQLLLGDERLSRVAEQAASEASRARGSRSDVRNRLWKAGIRDFEFLPLSITGEHAPDPRVLSSLLSDSAVDWSRFNTLAVGVAVRGAKVTSTVLLTRRTASFKDGFDPRFPVLTLPEDYDKPILFVTDPNGEVGERDCRVISARR